MAKLHPLKRWRRAQKPAPWRQADLAKAANVERWVVAFVESGRRVVDGHMVALEEVTGVRLIKRAARKQ